MNKFSIVKYVVIAAVIGGIYFSNQSDDTTTGTDYVEDEIDLNRVLDVTVDTLYAYQKELDAVRVSLVEIRYPHNFSCPFTLVLGIKGGLGIIENHEWKAI